MNKNTQTTETYNRGAEFFAKRFDSFGVRASDIETTFELTKVQNPKVLEIGCGNGRDAKEIIKRTSMYLGIDISEELIHLAKKNVPEANFQIADVCTFDFPSNLDIIFAFASLLHINIDNFSTVLDKAFNSLNSKGLLRISLKYAKHYTEDIEETEFGIRNYCYYSPSDIQTLAKNFKIVEMIVMEKSETMWLEIILQKE